MPLPQQAKQQQIGSLHLIRAQRLSHFMRFSIISRPLCETRINRRVAGEAGGFSTIRECGLVVDARASVRAEAISWSKLRLPRRLWRLAMTACTITRHRVASLWDSSL